MRPQNDHSDRSSLGDMEAWDYQYQTSPKEHGAFNPEPFEAERAFSLYDHTSPPPRRSYARSFSSMTLPESSSVGDQDVREGLYEECPMSNRGMAISSSRSRLMSSSPPMSVHSAMPQATNHDGVEVLETPECIESPPHKMEEDGHDEFDERGLPAVIRLPRPGDARLRGSDSRCVYGTLFTHPDPWAVVGEILGQSQPKNAGEGRGRRSASSNVSFERSEWSRSFMDEQMVADDDDDEAEGAGEKVTVDETGNDKLQDLDDQAEVDCMRLEGQGEQEELDLWGEDETPGERGLGLEEEADNPSPSSWYSEGLDRTMNEEIDELVEADSYETFVDFLEEQICERKRDDFFSGVPDSQGRDTPLPDLSHQVDEVEGAKPNHYLDYSAMMLTPPQSIAWPP